MTQSLHGNKHQEVDQTYASHSAGGRQFAGRMGPSGFVSNVDTFVAPRKHPADFGGFETSAKTDVGELLACTQLSVHIKWPVLRGNGTGPPAGCHADPSQQLQP